ncbi:MAG TPA: hypothetical protein VGL20_05605 [Candidatus Dormibacteraeota bacterium]
MGRRFIAVVAAGAIAGASSALIALAAFGDHASLASDPQQPSTLLESASGNGAGSLATAPASPVSGDPAAQGGSASSVVGRSQSGGALVVHGNVTATPPPVAGGHIAIGGTTWPLTTAPESSPSASPSAAGVVSVPTLPAVSLATPTAAPTVATPAPAAGGGTVTVQVPPLPLPLPLPTLPPVCVLVICLKP